MSPKKGENFCTHPSGPYITKVHVYGYTILKKTFLYGGVYPPHIRNDFFVKMDKTQVY
nr:MAG TPA: hypothetical protein [Caudoviricetes sp.]